jgi:hypothetical protein
VKLGTAFDERSYVRRAPVRLRAAFSAFALCFLAPVAALAQAAAPAAASDDFITVRLEPGVGLRTLSERYLDNPDLWPIILRANGVDDITDLAVGQELLLPGNQKRLSATALEASLSEIQRANESGAQLFAPLLIRNAIQYRDEAITHDREGIYAQSIDLSSRAINRAEAARLKSEEQRDLEAEARLSDRQGWVEGQKTTENSWSERDLNAILNEQEKLRTLSRSTAQVVFRDASRLRLNSNSQAVIQRMRVDPLKRREEAKISLVEGDFYALLATESDRNQLEVELENVDARIDSGSFWVSQDADGAKFSNYDVRPVSITAGDETLVLGRNEGAVVRNGEAPRDKIDIQTRIALAAPADEAVLYGAVVDLAWEEAETSGGYWLEIAFDGRFDRMADSLWGLETNTLVDHPLAPGTYYWRVAALDDFGLPGQMSSVRKFELRTDVTPPFLRIRTPEPDAVLREAAITISGETEAGAAVLVDGTVADTDRDGRFFLSITAREGRNEVSVVARDTAGNETERRIAFDYVADARRDIAYDPSLPRGADARFYSANAVLSLSGAVVGGARVSALDNEGRPRSETYADSEGRFALNVPLAARIDRFQVRVTTVSGYAYSETVEAEILDQPPQVSIAPVPSVTALPALDFVITTDAANTVAVNGASVAVVDGNATTTVTLAEGPNTIEIVATSPVGLVTIEKRTVLLDTVKPSITAEDVTVEARGATDFVSIRIGATDGAGLARTSRFAVRSGDAARDGVLRYNRAQKSYQGGVEIPRRADGDVVTIMVELSDIAGNVREVELVR